MNYTLHQLQVFYTITQTLSITKAAEELHLTQPAVSIQLKNLQDQFQIPLTEVIGRKLYVTDFGREIAAAAEEILNQVNGINYKTQAFKGQLSGKLKIAIVSTGKYVMPHFLADFLAMHEGIELKLDVTNKSGVLNSIENNEVDFALVSVLPDNLDIHNVELMSNQLFLIGNTAQVFEDKFYEQQLLQELPIIYREQGSGTRYTMEQFFKANELQVKKKFELSTNEAVKQATIAGLGYSVLPLIGIRNELQSKILQIIKVKGFPITTSWNLIWIKNKNFSPIAKAYLDFIKNQKESIIHDRFGWLDQFN